MSSRGTTTLSSLGQTYCCLTREPHLPCSMLKEIPAEALEAENSLTGIETRPKEMLAVAIARALIALKCSRLSWKRGGAEEKLLLLCPSPPLPLPYSLRARNWPARRGPVPSSSCLKKTKASDHGCERTRPARSRRSSSE